MQATKTAVIWNQIEELKYAVVDGDWTRFEGIYISACDSDDDLVSELGTLVWIQEGDDAGKDLIEYCTLSEFADAIRNGALIVECGFLP